MDQSAFYGVVSAINFTLLGLWWVAVEEGAGVAAETAATRRTAYLVSLQFVIPGSVSLIAQVAPEVSFVWRATFVVAGVVGAIAVWMLATELRARPAARTASTAILVAGVPLYLAVAFVAALPSLGESLPPEFRPIQVEAVLWSLIVFLGVQEAWLVFTTSEKST